MTLVGTLKTSAVATVATTATVVTLGARHARTAWAPLDAVSHIAWGDRAFACEKLDLRHTLVGAVLNAAAVTSWSALHELVSARRPRLLAAFATGAAVSTIAYITDYHVVPKRLMPGFEVHLPRRALSTIYVVLAASLAVGGLLAHARR